MSKIELILGDCLVEMKKIPDKSIDLVLTSPPYNVGVDYGTYKDNLGWGDYLKFTELWLGGVLRILKDDGRFCLNIPNAIKNSEGRVVYISPIFLKLCEDLSFNTMEWITWVKGKAIIKGDEYSDSSFCGNNTAWGSWKSPSNPYFRSLTESIIVFYKVSRKKEGHKENIDITADEFKEWTKNVWFIPTNSDDKHPAVYPKKMVNRLLKLFCYKNDLILDPFMGSGTTGIACKELDRNFIGIEISPKYYKIAEQRIKNTQEMML